MHYDEMQTALLSATGWELDQSPQTELSDDTWYRHGGTYQLKRADEFPSYLEDLDAMHDLVKTLTPFLFGMYRDTLAEICAPMSRCKDEFDQMKRAIEATAPQRAEAFLKVKGLWKEPKPATAPSREAMAAAAQLMHHANELDRP